MDGTSVSSDALPAPAVARAGSHASPELRRALANIRVIIAIVAAIESLALSAVVQPAVAFVVLCYTVYAGWLGWREASDRHPVSSPLASWIDALAILLIAWLVATPSSLFILLLLFPVLFASLSFGFASGLAVALFATAGAVIIARAQHGGVVSMESMLFPLSILGLGPIVAGLARSGVQMNDQVTIADRLLEQADPRLGLQRVAAIVLQALERHFTADLGLLLIWLPGCEPRLFRGDRHTRVVELHGELVDALLGGFSRLPREVASVHHVAHFMGKRRIRRHSGFHVARRRPTSEARTPMDELAGLLEAHSLVAVPVCRRSPHPCWLLLDSASGRHRSGDAELLFHVMEQLAPVIENASLLEQLSDEAMATERARIGRDLHDTAIQPYLGIKYGVEALARKATPDNSLHRDIAALQEMVNNELHELREAVSSMRGGAGRGADVLCPALRRQAKRFSELFGIEVAVDCEGDIPINRKLSDAFLHLISEALTNIRRHTRATRAEIQVTVEPQAFVLRIGNDHGPGAPPGQFVPRSIAERAESLNGGVTVDLRHPGVTELVVTIPRSPDRG